MAIVGILLWSVRYRYDQLHVGEYVVLVRTNRLTGNSQTFQGGRWVRAAQGNTTSSEQAEQDLPADQLRKVSFEATEVTSAADRITAEIYNGSNWTITELEIRGFSMSPGACMEKDPLKFIGCPDSLVDRTYRQRIRIPDLASTSTSWDAGVTPYDYSLLKQAGSQLVWRLKRAKGLPPRP